MARERKAAEFRTKYPESVSESVRELAWCFEPSQPKRIVSGMIENKQQRTVTNDERSKLLLNEGNYVRLNAGRRLKSSCIPPVNTAPHCDQTENL